MKPFTFVRGGAEIMLDRCSDSVGADGRKQKITNKSALQKLAAAIALTGKDVVALAVSERAIKDGRLPSGGYALVGLAALYDTPFDNAADEVKRLEKLGVKVLLATEESRESALFAAKLAGISGAKNTSKGASKKSEKSSTPRSRQYSTGRRPCAAWQRPVSSRVSARCIWKGMSSSRARSRQAPTISGVVV